MIGTEFEVSANSEFSRVDVTEGKVKFYNNFSNSELTVSEGEFATNKGGLLRFGKQIYTDTDIRKILLVDAKNDKEIPYDQLYDGIAIPYEVANRIRLNIRIYTGKGIKSIRVSHDGNEEHIQNDFPFTTLRINKALQDTYNVWQRGSHYIELQPFAEKEGVGPIGKPIVLNFTIN